MLLHDTVWVLPATPHTRENFQWLAAEIIEGRSEAMVWEAHFLLPGQDESLVQQFLAQVNDEYRALLAELAGGDADVNALARRYQSLQALDYFHSPLGEQVRRALMSLVGSADA